LEEIQKKNQKKIRLRSNNHTETLIKLLIKRIPKKRVLRLTGGIFTLDLKKVCPKLSKMPKNSLEILTSSQEKEEQIIEE
jgi:hypothetical protein